MPYYIFFYKITEQELLILPEHLDSPPVLSGVRFTRSLVLYVGFVDRCLSFCTFSFGHCAICSSSIYDTDCPFGIFKLFLHKTGNAILYLFSTKWLNHLKVLPSFGIFVSSLTTINSSYNWFLIKLHIKKCYIKGTCILCHHVIT